MDIRTVSDEEKRAYIDRVKAVFGDIRTMLDTLEKDIESDNLMEQASAVWIGGNLCTWYNDFMTQIRAIHEKKNELQKEIMDSQQKDAANEQI